MKLVKNYPRANLFNWIFTIIQIQPLKLYYGKLKNINNLENIALYSLSFFIKK